MNDLMCTLRGIVIVASAGVMLASCNGGGTADADPIDAQDAAFSIEDTTVDEMAVPSLAEIRAEEDSILEGYRWIDRDAGIAAIPVDRAIQILVERGAFMTQETEQDSSSVTDQP